MGDHAVAGSAYSASYDDFRSPSATEATSLPPQVVARWAALASARACGSVLPHQVLTTS